MFGKSLFFSLFIFCFSYIRLSRSPWGYGKWTSIDKTKWNDSFKIGFIDFEDQRDAADAVKALDGK
jgi:hypothetical protein